jgi:hypothetical protein
MGWGIRGFSLAFFSAAAGRLAVVAAMVALACAAPVGAGGDRGLPRMPGAPALVPAKLAAKPERPPPIVFFLAKGDANACGPGCNEWIAAEGAIDVGADARLRALLNKLGKRKLPIYFHSPGGAIPAGLGIGRILRQRGLTAGVGRTVPAGCDPKAAREPACDKLKRSGRELVADLDTASAMCNSACVFSLVGAAVREVDPSVRLGIHSASITFSLRRVDSSGHVIRTPTHVALKIENRALQENYDRIAAYMREMGIAPGLLEAARKIPSDRVRFLSRDEVIAFGIDRRELIDGLWGFVDQPSGAAAVKIVQWREPAARAFHRVILRVSCSTPETVRLQFARELGAERVAAPERFRVKFGTSDLPFGRPFMTTPLTGWRPLEVRTAYLPISVLHDATLVIEAAPSAATSSASAATASATSSSATSSALATTVTAQNIGSGLASLASRCMAPPARSTTVEHI